MIRKNGIKDDISVFSALNLMPVSKTAKTPTMLLKLNAILIKHCVSKIVKAFINLSKAA